jgi:hypothetical protein
MDSTKIKEIVVGLLTKSIDLTNVSDEDLSKANEILEYMLENKEDELIKGKFISPEQQKKNRAKAKDAANERAFDESGIMSPKEQKLYELPEDNQSAKERGEAKGIKVVKEEAAKSGDNAGANVGVDAGVIKQEFVKFDAQGQWSIQKAEEEGPTLNYREMNKPKENPNPTTIDYSSGEPKISGNQWSSKDTTKVPSTPNKLTAKEARIRQAVKEGKVIDDRVKR